MIIVLADDLTGAAEIAGLGHLYGLSVTLLTSLPKVLPQSQLVVLATDTRSMTAFRAVQEVQHLCRQLQGLLSKNKEKQIIFKKVDACLRGHVVEEIQAVLQDTDYQQSVYLPANPARGQVIRGGCLYIDDTPFDQTEYAPLTDTPAYTSSLCLHFSITPQSRIRVPDAVSFDDVLQIVGQVMDDDIPTLLTGSADLFTALLQNLGYQPTEEVEFPGLSKEGSTLVVCGSPHNNDLSRCTFLNHKELPLDSMPRDVFDGNQSASYWLASINLRHFSRAAIQPARNGLILNIPYERSCSAESALRLRTEMAQVVSALLDQMQPAELVIEGGTTALAIIQRMGWTHFDITDHISSTILRMQCPDLPSLHITFKPGSAPWGSVSQ